MSCRAKRSAANPEKRRLLPALTFRKTGDSAGKQPALANGFTMAELVMTLLIGVIISSILVLQTSVLLKGSRVVLDDQEQFAILQIREMLSLSRTAGIEENALVLELDGKEQRLEADKNRLVKRPGYEILMEQVSGIRFERKGESIYLVYQKQEKERSFQIG